MRTRAFLALAFALLPGCTEKTFAPYGEVSSIHIGRMKHSANDGEIKDRESIAALVALLNAQRREGWQYTAVKGTCVVTMNLYLGDGKVGTVALTSGWLFVVEEGHMWGRKAAPSDVRRIHDLVPVEKVHPDCRQVWLAQS